MENKELKVGDRIYSKKGCLKITKVGRKYYHIKGESRETFKIEKETLRYEDPMYSQLSKQFYLSEEAIKEQELLIELDHKVGKFFKGYGMTGLNINQLQQILSIINQGPQ